VTDAPSPTTALRLACLDARAVLLDANDRAIDLTEASGGRFSPDPLDALARWDELRAATPDLLAAAGETISLDRLGPPVPRPPKIFAIGLNYRDHAAEAGLDAPTTPMVFTKFANSLTGPDATVELSPGADDWEVELVAVIGRGGRHITEADALDHVAGYCVGQDVSDRIAQWSDNPAQFSMGKSYDGFGPIGPAIVDAAAVGDPQALGLWCERNGERVQDGTTADMIFGVAPLVSYLSSFCTLSPGDLIFTGTPAGVGASRQPAQFLTDGDVLVSGIDRLSTITTRFVSR
jgi:2,4-diketo-3-deoxy-L-fuconate hydrolase